MSQFPNQPSGQPSGGYQPPGGYPGGGMPPRYPGQVPGHGHAVASMVLGICSLVIPFIGTILAIVGIALAISAKNQGYVGGMATAGLVCSIVALALSVVMLFTCWIPLCAFGACF
ncbi:MAG: DUF4190 domain-containing protein [Defluviitaleaceae bacterium]|nr:DUF4190 domain-containing protein [Defluviitaleaceae bacterium]